MHEHASAWFSVHVLTHSCSTPINMFASHEHETYDHSKTFVPHGWSLMLQLRDLVTLFPRPCEASSDLNGLNTGSYLLNYRFTLVVSIYNRIKYHSIFHIHLCWGKSIGDEFFQLDEIVCTWILMHWDSDPSSQPTNFGIPSIIPTQFEREVVGLPNGPRSRDEMKDGARGVEHYTSPT